MPTITVHYYAGTRDRAGCSSESLEIDPDILITSLRTLLSSRHPSLAPMLTTCRFAIDDDFAFDQDPIPAGCAIHVLPPVSGGAGAPVEPKLRGEIIDRPLSIGEATGQISMKGAGAIATFTGIVRDHSKGRQVEYLHYEAHGPLAAKELDRIAQEAIAAHGLVDCFVVHRVGRLEVGDVAVDIAASAAHRGEALEGCRYVIEEIKLRGPIWKKETGPDGSEWVEGGA